MDSLTVRSYAKINWMLRILGKRDDGFHELETIFQTIALHDVMRFRIASEYALTCSDETIPTDERNLITRAWLAMREAYDVPPVHVAVEKAIPSGGGLGGGSSNAAATLLAVAKIAGTSVDRAELSAIGATLGSDVPFFLHGGCAYATGRGEVIEGLPSSGRIPMLLLRPSERVATADAYRWLAQERMQARSKPAEPVGVVEAKRVAANLAGGVDVLVNDLEAPVFAQLPRLAQLRDTLAASGAFYARMSGSGSTIVGAFHTEKDRDRAATILGPTIRAVASEAIDAPTALADFQRD